MEEKRKVRVEYRTQGRRRYRLSTLILATIQKNLLF